MNCIFPVCELSLTTAQRRHSLQERVDEYRQLLTALPIEEECVPAPVSSSDKATSMRWHADDLWLHEDEAAAKSVVADSVDLWAEAALVAIGSCRVVDSEKLVTFPDKAAAPTACPGDGLPVAGSLSDIACGVLCKRYPSRIAFLNGLVDVILTRCAPTMGSNSHGKEYALKLLKHVCNDVAESLLPIAPNRHASVFPCAWIRSKNDKMSSSAARQDHHTIMSRRRHAIRCVATKSLDLLVAHIQTQLVGLQRKALLAAQLRQLQSEALAIAADQQQSKSKATKKSATLKLKAATSTATSRHQTPPIVVASPLMQYFSKLLQELSTVVSDHVSQGAYDNLSAVYREVEWIILTTASTPPVAGSNGSRDPELSAARAATRYWKSSCLDAAVKCFTTRHEAIPESSSNEGDVVGAKAGSSLTVVPCATEVNGSDGAAAAFDARRIALSIINHLETVDTAHRFADPFWRQHAGGAAAARTVTHHHYDSTMLMRYVLMASLRHTAMHSEEEECAIVVGDDSLCTRATQAMLVDPLGCYQYMCSALERVVDDSVVLYGPHHECSVLAEAMRRELTKRAMASGLLQR